MTDPTEQHNIVKQLRDDLDTWKDVALAIDPTLDGIRAISRLASLCYQALDNPSRKSPTLQKILIERGLVIVKPRYRKIAEMENEDQMLALDRVAQEAGFDDWTHYCRYRAEAQIAKEKTNNGRRDI